MRPWESVPATPSDGTDGGLGPEQPGLGECQRAGHRGPLRCSRHRRLDAARHPLRAPGDRVSNCDCPFPTWGVRRDAKMAQKCAILRHFCATRPCRPTKGHSPTCSNRIVCATRRGRPSRHGQTGSACRKAGREGRDGNQALIVVAQTFFGWSMRPWESVPATPRKERHQEGAACRAAVVEVVAASGWRAGVEKAADGCSERILGACRQSGAGLRRSSCHVRPRARSAAAGPTASVAASPPHSARLNHDGRITGADATR